MPVSCVTERSLRYTWRALIKNQLLGRLLMLRRVMECIATCVVLTGLLAMARGGSSGDSWPTFRGAQRTATAPDTGLLTAWPEGGPYLAWQTAGAGRGYSSLAIAGGRIYTLGDAPSTASDEDEYLVCFDQTDGKQLWKTKTGPAWKEGKPTWQSSRSTPTVDGDRVYVVTPHGTLVCCRTDGQELWRKEFAKEFAGKKADGWGYSESVLVDGDKLVCTPGGPTNTMVALDKVTGETRWTTSRPKIVAPATRRSSSPMSAAHASMCRQPAAAPWACRRRRQAAVDVRHRADHGRDSHAHRSRRSGVFRRRLRPRRRLLKQVPGAAGEVAMEVVYPLKKELGNKHGGVVLVGDYLYGDSEDRGIPYCAELLTGDVKWKSRGTGHDSASFVAADGHLYIHYADGTMTLVKASPEAFEEVGHFEVPGSGERPSWSHPVVLDGKLYIREGDVIVCYNVRSQGMIRRPPA